MGIPNQPLDQDPASSPVQRLITSRAIIPSKPPRSATSDQILNFSRGRFFSPGSTKGFSRSCIGPPERVIASPQASGSPGALTLYFVAARSSSRVTSEINRLPRSAAVRLWDPANAPRRWRRCAAELPAARPLAGPSSPGARPEVGAPANDRDWGAARARAQRAHVLAPPAQMDSAGPTFERACHACGSATGSGPSDYRRAQPPTCRGKSLPRSYWPYYLAGQLLGDQSPFTVTSEEVSIYLDAARPTRLASAIVKDPQAEE